MKTKLTFEEYKMPAANLKKENAMPDMKNVDYIHAGIQIKEGVPKQYRQNIGKGMITTILPYCLQDNYDREREIRSFRAAVLENENLKAVFLPELGGRLWSLYDKREKRELLYKNPVFQPGNLALRNAWFSGGVEWNVGIKGHNPLTCSPMFASRLVNAEGMPVLRMYEYERIRGVAYRIEALLPENSKVLYIKASIENNTENEKYMYWWSNIAVPETEETRVIVPAEKTLVSLYSEGAYMLDIEDLPVGNQGQDITYPKNAERSKDFFFLLPDNQLPWIFAAGKDGKGLFQFSTKELIGRKAFVWGQGQGGRNWSKWLSSREQPYIEIQAGLARTQLEHLSMPAQTEWSWVEGYAAGQIVSENWENAIQEGNAFAQKLLEQYDETQIRQMFDGLAEEVVIYKGSGWGALENRLRTSQKQAPVSRYLQFSGENDLQKQWIALLETGTLPPHNSEDPPESYVTDPVWIRLLEKSIRRTGGDFYSYLQLGVMQYAVQNIDQAEMCFLKSIEKLPNAWAYRNLAMLYQKEKKDQALACRYMLKAVEYNQTNRGLMLDCASILIEAGAYQKWLNLYFTLGEELRKDGRLQFYQARAYLALGEYEKAAQIIQPSFVLPDVKEGEISISKIWFELYDQIVKLETGLTDLDKIRKIREEKYPLPQALDFRMD